MSDDLTDGNYSARLQRLLTETRTERDALIVEAAALRMERDAAARCRKEQSDQRHLYEVAFDRIVVEGLPNLFDAAEPSVVASAVLERLKAHDAALAARPLLSEEERRQLASDVRNVRYWHEPRVEWECQSTVYQRLADAVERYALTAPTAASPAPTVGRVVTEADVIVLAAAMVGAVQEGGMVYRTLRDGLVSLGLTITPPPDDAGGGR